MGILDFFKSDSQVNEDLATETLADNKRMLAEFQALAKEIGSKVEMKQSFAAAAGRNLARLRREGRG